MVHRVGGHPVGDTPRACCPLAAACAVVGSVRWRQPRPRGVPTARADGLPQRPASRASPWSVSWPALAAIATRNAAAFTDDHGLHGPRTSRWEDRSSTGSRWPSPIRRVIGALRVPCACVITRTRPSDGRLPRSPRLALVGDLIYMLYIFAATKPSAGILRYVLVAVFPLVPLLEARSSASSRADSDRRSGWCPWPSRWRPGGPVLLGHEDLHHRRGTVAAACSLTRTLTASGVLSRARC